MSIHNHQIHSRKKFRQLFQRKPFTTSHANPNFIMPLSFSGSNTPINISISQNPMDCSLSSASGYNQGNENRATPNKMCSNPFSRKKNKHYINEQLKEKLSRTEYGSLPLNDEDLNHRLRLEKQYEKQVFERVQGYRQKQNFDGHKTRQQILFEKLVKKRQGINRSTEEYRKSSKIKMITMMETNTWQSKNLFSDQNENQFEDEKSYYESQNGDGALRLNFKHGLDSKQTRNQFEDSLESQKACYLRKKCQTSRQPLFSKVSQVIAQTERLNTNSISTSTNKQRDSIDQQLKFLREQHRKLKTSREKYCSNDRMSDRLGKFQPNRKIQRIVQNNILLETYKKNEILLRGELQLSSKKNVQLQDKLEDISKKISVLETRLVGVESEKLQIIQKNNELIQLVFSKQPLKITLHDSKHSNNSNNSNSSNNNLQHMSFNPSYAHTQKFSEPDSLEKVSVILSQENYLRKQAQINQHQFIQETPRFSLHFRKPCELKSLNQSDRGDEQSALKFLDQSIVRLSSSGRRSQKQSKSQTKCVSANESRDSEDYLIKSLIEDIKNLKRKDLSDAIQQICNQENKNGNGNLITLKNIPLRDDYDRGLDPQSNRQRSQTERQSLSSKSEQEIKEQVQRVMPISPQLNAFMSENQTLKDEILVLQAKLENQSKTIRLLQIETSGLRKQTAEAGQKETFYQQQILHMKDVLDRIKVTNKNLFNKMKEVAEQKHKIQEICSKMHQQYLANIAELNQLKTINQAIVKEKILLESQISNLKEKISVQSFKTQNSPSHPHTQSLKELTIKDESIESNSETDSKKLENYDLILGIFGVNPDVTNHNDVLMKKIVLFQNNIIKITTKLSALEEHIHEMEKEESYLKSENSLLRKKVRQLSMCDIEEQQKAEYSQDSSMTSSFTSSGGLNKYKSSTFKDQSQGVALFMPSSIKMAMSSGEKFFT